MARPQEVHTRPAMVARPRSAPRQPQAASMAWARGATTSVPTPAAQSTTEVARERCLVKLSTEVLKVFTLLGKGPYKGFLELSQ